MARPEYPTSIRLTSVDKRRLRKHANKYKHSLAGLIQMILLQWLTAQEQAAVVVTSDYVVQESPAAVEDTKPLAGRPE